MSLDLNKPVQVDPDLSNEWVDCSFARKLNGHPEDRYAVIYSRFGGRERIGLYEARFLRNTPEPPRRVPYTAETWPAWAIWARHKKWIHDTRHMVGSVCDYGVLIFYSNEPSYQCLADDWEISGTDGVWHPASREVTP